MSSSAQARQMSKRFVCVYASSALPFLSPFPIVSVWITVFDRSLNLFQLTTKHWSWIILYLKLFICCLFWHLWVALKDPSINQYFLYFMSVVLKRGAETMKKMIWRHRRRKPDMTAMVNRVQKKILQKSFWKVQWLCCYALLKIEKCCSTMRKAPLE